MSDELSRLNSTLSRAVVAEQLLNTVATYMVLEHDGPRLVIGPNAAGNETDPLPKILFEAIWKWRDMR